VTGPKAWDFYDRFCGHKATLLKAHGIDILAVTMGLNAHGDSNRPAVPCVPVRCGPVAFPADVAPPALHSPPEVRASSKPGMRGITTINKSGDLANPVIASRTRWACSDGYS